MLYAVKMISFQGTVFNIGADILLFISIIDYRSYDKHGDQQGDEYYLYLAYDL
jgi:hypothetical protein